MTKLSVNINKIATLRNARGGDVPNVVEAARKIESFGAQGITVHPRPDERHIRYQDVRDLKPVLTTEFNIEGKPIQQFTNLVLEVKPAQVTLVPDAEDAITSNAGWDTIKYESYLKEVISEFQKHGIRTSIFVDADKKMIEGAAKTGTDRIELYTEQFATDFAKGKEDSAKAYAECAGLAQELGLEINAGHDLSLDNIEYFKKAVPHLAEVSIGHALISEALFMGLEKTIQQYLKFLK
ncbi:MAG: pyridoxine 5'-phosphate synthase [Bacteroidota bacterium]|nr:pyridoxine 5'-phosphate synthase [Bacteroidota bacterium]